MVSLINFGNLKQVNGKTILSGSQSGLDTSSIIDQLATAKRLPATKFEDNIKINNNKITALTEMKTKLTALQNAVGKLRNPVGYSSASNSSAFDARTPYVTMSSGDTASNYVGVATANGAPLGNYNIQVTNLATAQSDISESFANLTDSVVVADNSGGPATGKFNAGTFNIGYKDSSGAAQNVGINLAAGANLATVRDTINSKTSVTGVKATIIKYSDTDYRLKLYSDNTGIASAYSFTNGTGGKVNFTDTPADDARITLDGQPIQRSGNVIDDLIDNVTLTLYQPTAGATVNLQIDKNSQGVATSVGDFLNAYNDLRTFAAQQSDVNADGTPKDTAYLKGNSVMQTVLSQLSSIISGSKGAGLLSPTQLAQYGGSASITKPKTLADLGIYFTDIAAVTDGATPTPAVNNVLSIDPSKLGNYLQKYFSDTRSLFEFNFVSDNSEVSSYTRGNAVYNNNIGSFAININNDAGTANVTGLKDAAGNPIVPANADLDYSVSNGTVTLKGKAGTKLEGMQFFYTGTVSGSTTANITVSQGVGDVMFNSLDSYLQDANGQLGTIDKEITSLQDQNKDAQASVDRIDTMVTTYRSQMLDKFSALEALVSASNQTLMLLDAQSNAANNSGH